MKNDRMNDKILDLVRGEYIYLSDYNQVINASIKDMFLEYGTNRKIEIRDVAIDEEMIKKQVRNISQLIFEVTENCNLKCKYCVYNGHYINYRKLSPRAMDFETARKGIDYVFSFINSEERKEKELFLSFYGGEPLLNIKTMKKIIEYSRKRFTGWILEYNMTTNLTLLDDFILDFLLENKVNLMVSLDGDRSNHDSKRVFVNGKGTHDIVLKNLEKIKKRDNDYFNKNIMFSTVYSLDLPLKNLHKFFSADTFIKKKSMIFSTVSTFDTSYYQEYPYDNERYIKELKDICSQILEKVGKGEELSGYERFMFTNFEGMEKVLNIRGATFLAGACLFGHRLYLDVSGRFHICEKMNSTFPFGDVDRGFDFKKMAFFARSFADEIKTHCSECNIRFLCKRCYTHFAGDGEFRLDPEFCKKQKEICINNLENYIKYKEEGVSTVDKKIKKFHQFVVIEKGPVNAAVIDLLKGNVFQVENKMIEAFERGEYEEIAEFLDVATEEGLLIEIHEKKWIPPRPAEMDIDSDEEDKVETSGIEIELHVEEGIDLDVILNKFNDYTIHKVVLYGPEIPKIEAQNVKIVKAEKDFQQCMAIARVDGEFERISESTYVFNKIYNSCWGRKVAVTKEGKVRPCVYSSIAVGNIDVDDVSEILEKMREYWTISKDKVEKCKDCELKHICPDCRELALQEGGNLFSPHPMCNYDPYKGAWTEG
jgi:uncharacterized protein